MNTAEKIIDAIEKLVPEYLSNPDDKNVSNGNLAVCIIDENNNVYGKLLGSNIIRTRESYQVAWTKASQVWITGYKTGEYEALVFTNQVDEWKYGIMRPDFIGWEGGQPVVLKDGTKLSVGFSGLRGTSDLEIVVRAIENIQ